MLGPARLALALLLLTSALAEGLVLDAAPAEADDRPLAADPTVLAPSTPAEASAQERRLRAGVADLATTQAVWGDVPTLTTGTSDHDHAHMQLAPTPRTMQAAEGPGGTADITFVCPEYEEVLGVPVPQISETGNDDDPIVYGCPFRIYDEGYSFGNPDIVVNDEDHSEIAFFALHGEPVNNGFSERTRSGLTHTAFTSDTQGLKWQDQPTEYPQGSGFGEFGDGTMDSSGNIYVSYLWERPNGQAWDPVIGLYKAGPTSEVSGVDSAYDFGSYVGPRDKGNTISSVHIVQVPPAEPPAETPVNETAPPSGDDDTGNLSVEEALDNETIVSVWHETALAYNETVTGLSAWIDAAWTNTSGSSGWNRINESQLIGPCKDASNAVAYDGKVYVACVIDRGYSDRNRAKIGDIDFWSIDPQTGLAELVGDTRAVGGHPILAVNEEGLFTMLVQSKDHLDDGHLQKLTVSYHTSWYGKSWEKRHPDIGGVLRSMGGGDETPLIDADITALVMTSDDNTGLLVYKEWHDNPEEITEEDLANPSGYLNRQLTDYNKFLLTFTPCSFPLAGAEMELGTAVDVNNADAYRESPDTPGSMFNDVQDGLFVTREASGREIIYFAINDYGAVQFGGVIVSGADQQVCVYPPPVVAPPPAVIPQALTLASPGTVAAGITVGVPAAAMVAYLLTSKKKLPHFAVAEDD